MKVLRQIVSWVFLILLLSFGYFYLAVLPNSTPANSASEQGTVPCQVCSGKGGVACQMCDGRGRTVSSSSERCQQCGGTGKYSKGIGRSKDSPCVFCNSTGAVKKEESSRCHNCGGRGTVRCDACQGKGVVSEPKTKGQRLVSEIKRTVPMYGDWVLGLVGLKKDLEETEDSA